MFLAAGPRDRAWVVLVGAPFDATATFRAGARHAPAAIRRASQSIETYSPVLRADLEQIGLADDGDLDLEHLDAAAAVEAVAARIGAIVSGGAGSDRARPPLPVLIGGEHTVTLGAVRALRRIHPALAVLQVDAHTDLREEYEGRAVSHATVMKRVVELVGAQAVVSAGIRAGTREEFALARTLRHSSASLAIPSDVWTWLGARPVYVTIDIDAVDPADAPGTGNPEPEGLSAREVLAFVRRLGELRVVGVDLVEVSPPYDPSGRTAVLAATILREAVLALSRPTPA